MKSFGLAVAAAAVVLLTASNVGAQAPDLAKLDIVLRAVPDGPVARVNGESIDADDFRELYRSELGHILARNPKEFTTGDRVQLGLLCLRQLIDRKILLQQARKRNLTISEQELNAAYSQQMEQFVKAFSQAGGANVTEHELLENLETTREDVREELSKALLIEKMRDDLLKEKGVRVSEAELRQLYETHKKDLARPDACHMKQIFFAGDIKSTRKDAAKIRLAARRKAEEALQRIQAGQSFEAVARDMSEGQHKEQGGDWGNQPVALLPPFLVEVAYSLQPDQHSAIIESDHGYHIVKLVSITPGAEPDFDKLKPLLERQLLNEKSEDVIAEFCRNVMDNGGKLDVYLELERSIMLESGVLDRVSRAQ
jgi:parvulin-like peptidyl-prolyl isomerase